MSLSAQDSIAILQLAARADACASARDAGAYADLFTEDAVMDGDQGTVRGREALRDAVARVWAAEPAGTLHLTLNAVIDEAEPDPTVSSVLVMVAPGLATPWVGSATIRQVVSRAPAGWLIRSRSIRALT